MVQIISEEQNKVKRMKRTEDSLRDLWDNIKQTNIQIIGVPEEEEKKKGTRKFLKILQLKISPIWERKQSSPRGTKGPIQNKPKKKHKTHTNQTNKD